MSSSPIPSSREYFRMGNVLIGVLKIFRKNLDIIQLEMFLIGYTKNMHIYIRKEIITT